MPESASEAARILRSLPRAPKVKTCPVCGITFEGRGNRAKYCSAECRWQAWPKTRRGSRRLTLGPEEAKG